MQTRWQSRDTAVALPTATARAMWDRARRFFDVTRGGRFDARSANTLLIWSGRLDAAGAVPVGAVTVKWDWPMIGQTTIHQVAWSSRRGGSEAEVWRSIAVLAGGEWPLDKQRLGSASDESASAA